MNDPQEENRLRKKGRKYRDASIGMVLPMMMLAGPLSGLLLGMALIWFFQIGQPWDARTKLICVLLGTVAGFRETYLTVKKLGKD